jgi:TRAP-type C4-dicarboxylate transport system permease large subunit
MIWFGIIVVIVSEIGLITPPIGMNVFVVKSVIPDARLRDIFAGVVPFIFALLLGLVLLFMMPSIATFLPKLMG